MIDIEEKPIDELIEKWAKDGSLRIAGMLLATMIIWKIGQVMNFQFRKKITK